LLPVAHGGQLCPGQPCNRCGATQGADNGAETIERGFSHEIPYSLEKVNWQEGDRQPFIK
jgi:hypothetical protein